MEAMQQFHVSREVSSPWSIARIDARHLWVLIGNQWHYVKRLS